MKYIAHRRFQGLLQTGPHAVARYGTGLRRRAATSPAPTVRTRAPALTVIAGCGDVGLRLLRGQSGFLRQRRLRIVATCRRPEQAQAIRAEGAIALTGDLSDTRFLRRLAALCSTGSAGLIWTAPPPAQGSRDPWSRRMLAALGARVSEGLSVTYVSTTGVYGDRQGQWTDETTPLRPANARAIRRVDAENAWRGRDQSRARAATRPLRAVTVLRAPGIYAEERLPVERLQAGTPAIAADQDSWSNHIHANDLARLSWRARWRQQGRRVINAVDNKPTRMGDYFDTVAEHFGLPRPPRLPRDAVKAAVSPMLWSFMSESRRLRNARLKELGIALHYPDVQSCLDRMKFR